MKLYQVKGWETHFEGAKSKTYSHKSTCQMPTKHGLGFRYIIEQKEGAAIFGAWCAMIQILSRHDKPRQGYCTDTGRIDGVPYTSKALFLLTGIKEKYFDDMFQTCSSQIVNWMTVTESRILDGYHADTAGPLNSDSDSDSDSDLNSDSLQPGGHQAGSVPDAVITIPLIPSHGEYGIIQKQVDQWTELFPGVQVMQTLREIKAWNIANPSRRKTRRGIEKHVVGWLLKEQNKA